MGLDIYAPMKPRVAIFDLDGTLADTAHRQHFMEQRPKDWAAFYAAMVDDVPREEVVALARLVHRHMYPVIICTGRPRGYRQITELWLSRYNIGARELHMRVDDDHRDDVIVKREMLQTIRAEYNPVFAVDDRAKVVAMWREEGLVCFQCAEGLF